MDNAERQRIAERARVKLTPESRQEWRAHAEMNIRDHNYSSKGKAFAQHLILLEDALAAAQASRDDFAMRLHERLNDYEEVKRQRDAVEAGRDEEKRIVDRVWKALGIETYEQAGGKSIDEIVSGMKAEIALLRPIAEAARREHGLMTIRPGKLSDALRAYEAWQRTQRPPEGTRE